MAVMVIEGNTWLKECLYVYRYICTHNTCFLMWRYSIQMAGSLSDPSSQEHRLSDVHGRNAGL
jgi:hypothetical protein